MPKKGGVPAKTAVLVRRSRRGKRPEHWAKSGPRPMITVTLTTNHSVNGKAYGARDAVTEVRVPEPVARHLQWQEERRRENDLRFLHPPDARIILTHDGGHYVKRLPPNYFDIEMAEVMAGHAEPSFHYHPRHLP